MCDDALIFSTLFSGIYNKEDVDIIWQPTPRSMPAEMNDDIQQYWNEQQNKTLFNGQLARLDHWAATHVSCKLVLRPSDYQTLVYSNQHIQHIKESWGPQYLSRALGISVVAVSNDDQLLIMERSATVGEYPNCSDVFGGHIDVAEGNTPCVFSSMSQEMHDEMGLAPDEFSLSLLGMIEATRHKKPELVFLARINLSAKEIISRAEKAKDNIEFSKIYTIFNSRQRISSHLKENGADFSPSAFGSLCVYMQANFNQPNREG